LDPNQPEAGCVVSSTEGNLASSRGDTFCACHAQQGDGDIAQSGHDLGTLSSAHLRAVFVEGDVPNPMQAILD